MTDDLIRKEFEMWLADTQGKHMVSKWNEISQDYNHLACTIALEAYKAGRTAKMMSDAEEVKS